MRQLFIIAIMSLWSTHLQAQQLSCFSATGYATSVFQVARVDNNKYKVVTMELGEPYLNPCVDTIDTDKENSIARIAGLLQNSESDGIEVYQLLETGCHRRKMKNKRYKQVARLDVLSKKARFDFKIDLADKYVLFFVDPDDVTQNIAIEIVKL